MHCASEKGFEDIGEKFKVEKVVSEEICHLLHLEEIETRLISLHIQSSNID